MNYPHIDFQQEALQAVTSTIDLEAPYGWLVDPSGTPREATLEDLYLDDEIVVEGGPSEIHTEVQQVIDTVAWCFEVAFRSGGPA